MQHTYVFKNKDCFANKTAEQRLVPVNQLSNNLDLGLLVIAFWIYFVMQAWPNHSGSTFFIIKKKKKV